MTYFPQLSTGNVSQYPLLKRQTVRVISNILADGSTIRQLDVSPMISSWELQYNSLSDDERSQLEAFFVTCQGRLNTFTLLDPTLNLLKYSEDFENGVWIIDPGLTVVSGILAPNGLFTAATFTASAALPRRIRQAIQAPGTFTYCFSFYAKSEVTQSINVHRQGGSFTKIDSVKLSSTWNRYWYSGSLQQDVPAITVGIEIPTGGQIHLHGLQVMAQPGPGIYQKSSALNGVYKKVRFAEDRLIFTSNGMNDNSIKIRLTTTG